MIKESKVKFNYDYKKSEGVKDFDKEVFPNQFLALICGKPVSVITTLLKFLLAHNDLTYKKFDFIFIVSPELFCLIKFSTFFSYF